MNSVKHMGEEPIGRLLWRYSMPAILGFLAGALYQLVDRIMVGRGIGTDAVAAVTAAYPLSILGLAAGMLLGAGTGNRISVLLGKGDVAEAERYLGQALRLSMFAGATLAAVTWAFTAPLLRVCGCAEGLLPQAIPFARVMAIGQAFLIALLSMGNILRVQGRPMVGLAVMVASNVVNAVLAAVAIYVLHWGVTGTAAATATAQCLASLAVILFVQSRQSILHIRRIHLRHDAGLARGILTLGAPPGLTQVLATVVFLSANHGAGSVAGTRGVAALGVLNTVALLLLYPPFGVMQAMQPLLGYNRGCENWQRVRAILVRALLTTTSMGLMFSALVALAPRALASLFSRNDAQLIDMVAEGLPWFVLPLVLFGLSGTMAHYFLTLHEPRKSAALMLGRQLLAIPLFLLLPGWLGFRGVYLVGPAADALFSLFAGWFAVKELRQLTVRCRSVGQ